jgi:hypothetical protein
MAQAQGTIVQSIGAVIDIEFPREGMPGKLLRSNWMSVTAPMHCTMVP